MTRSQGIRPGAEAESGAQGARHPPQREGCKLETPATGVADVHVQWGRKYMIQPISTAMPTKSPNDLAPYNSRSRGASLAISYASRMVSRLSMPAATRKAVP